MVVGDSTCDLVPDSKPQQATFGLVELELAFSLFTCAALCPVLLAVRNVNRSSGQRLVPSDWSPHFQGSL